MAAQLEKKAILFVALEQALPIEKLVGLVESRDIPRFIEHMMQAEVLQVTGRLGIIQEIRLTEGPPPPLVARTMQAGIEGEQVDVQKLPLAFKRRKPIGIDDCGFVPREVFPVLHY